MPNMNLRIPPQWDELDGVQNAVWTFLQKQGCDGAVSQAVVMGASELTENAIKYGDYEGEQDIHLSIVVHPRHIVVEVCNPITPEDATDLRKLDAMVQWIRGFQDPFEAYVERLKVVSLLSLTSAESGLGLARIAYEGRGVLDFFVTEDNALAVSAVYQLS